MVYRVYVEKRPGLTAEADALLGDIRTLLRIESLESLRLFNRYDVENITPELFDYSVKTILSEPQLDLVTDTLPEGGIVFAVEYLPGQFDQRADSAAQCIQILSQGDRPLVRSARVYQLMGNLTAEDVAAIKKYLINPVESREASLEPFETLVISYEIPESVATLEGFRDMDEEALKKMVADFGLAMDLDDLRFCRDYFRTEERDPTMTELKVIDTYWSDHCRHTTFLTTIDGVEFQSPILQQTYEEYLSIRKRLNRTKPINLMDIGTIVAKYLKKQGKMPKLDESEEINACTVKIKVDTADGKEDWLLLFKNETHNHPTEIEPFGGAATCIGGCIRDPLSGRVYVHQAMRFTGGGDPRVPFDQTLEGKLPQRKLATTAAAGYSSYGNQIGLATGHVAEVYHDGYIAKRLECGAVVGAAPAENVVRERPAPGDVVILLGGRTGRDGIGGATGSSKSHNKKSLTTMASEVQKGNAPEERKIQRLFRNGEVTRLVKRCNDFGAGGVSVAIGELADGLEIELDAVRKKYDGLDGTELAISESQERMAVVVAAEDVDKFIAAAEAENLEAYRVATVTESPRMVMHWKGLKIADLSREFLNTNGAVKHAAVSVDKADRSQLGKAQFTNLKEMAASLKCGSRRGLTERFDGSIGAASVLMPFGGKTQATPAQAMAALFPVLPGQETDQASVMAWGFDPERTSVDPYAGSHDAVYTSIAKLVAAGADYHKAYLTFQEFFEKLRNEPQRWGKPFSALLGALDAQLELEAAAIGGKDSMSGSFLDKDVPPTLISFAIAPVKADKVLSPEFKAAEHPVYLFASQDSKAAWEAFHALHQSGKVKAAWAVENGLAEAVMNMSFGNRIGFQAGMEAVDWYAPQPGAIVAELTEEINDPNAIRLGETTQAPFIALPGEAVSVDELRQLNDGVLEKVYPTLAGTSEAVAPISWDKRSPAVCKHKCAHPKAVIPVFPGTNCEYDTAQACIRAGIDPEIVVVRNLTTDFLAQSAQALEQAIRSAQMVVLPGGFSGGDEPDGSGKFIASFLRSPAIAEAIMDLLKNRDGLMLGICNGFQALVKLGLVPYGEIRPMDDSCPTLTYNLIGRHQSRYVTTRVASVQSPWMLKSNVGDLHTIPISHGEGRFVGPQSVIDSLIANGQAATQYVDLNGQPTMDIAANPNGSMAAIEGIFSPDGRVFGKMGHLERRGPFVGVNIPGNKHQPLFESGAEYFK